VFTARYGLSPYVLKRNVLSLKNLPGRGLTKFEKHCSKGLIVYNRGAECLQRGTD